MCLVLVIVHIVSNYFAVTSLELNTLNEDRLSLIIEDYILYHTISNVEEINSRESVFILLEKPGKIIKICFYVSHKAMKNIIQCNMFCSKTNFWIQY